MMTHQQREKALDEARTRDIVSVARQLGMDMKHIGKNYLWVEHDSFVLNTKKNMFYWNSRQVGGDAIKLVQLMKKCSFKDAVTFLNQENFQEFTEPLAYEKPFHYYLTDHDTTKKNRRVFNERTSTV